MTTVRLEKINRLCKEKQSKSYKENAKFKGPKEKIITIRIEIFREVKEKSELLCLQS